MNNYLEMKITDPEITFIMEKLFSIIHAFISKNREGNVDCQIGITFPYWNQEQNKVDTGDIIRLFSNRETLEHIKLFEGIVFLLKSRAIKIYEIKDTPSVTQYVRFSRDRKIEKTTTAYMRRDIKYIENKSKDDVEKNSMKKLYKKSNEKINSTYYLKLNSKSTKQQQFSLFIQCSKVNNLGNSFSSYGLSNDIEKDNGLPYF